jgi:hypothetical protein
MMYWIHVIDKKHVWLSVCGSVYYLTIAIFRLVTKSTVNFIRGPYYYLRWKLCFVEAEIACCSLRSCNTASLPHLPHSGEWINSLSTVHVNSGDTFHYFGRTGSDPKLNALNWIRPSKKKFNFYFYF